MKQEISCYCLTNCKMLPAAKNHSLKVRFWGVRGSIPVPDERYSKVGGNTPCVVLQYASEPPVIIDAGTGLRVYGQSTKSTLEDPFRATLLLSHFHWDHIQGLPFFTPIYSKNTELNIWSGVSEVELESNLAKQMTLPFFPVSFDDVPAACSFRQIEADGFRLGSLRILPVTLNHPGGATGFRIDSPTASLIYVSDHEHGATHVDEQVKDKASGADLMIYDAHFTPDEYPSFKGWGHSTWEEGARMAARAKVKKLILFHHSPNRTDQQVQGLVSDARTDFSETLAANETLEFDFGLPE